ncbi:nucleoside hydrolase [Lentzea flaviverrucosa]|uniref:Inosine-uridine nucleoside N-ribohydrolase n=1 Tax=Lentzea flaviverrucosa TaxID=200379 RepID=A0A1H9RT70_9PSEU|nr:nucleoside hydrolase [Lentzea flaviverrucosa]RDI33108.1 inosine-uridine nucleoside N-ribohydrolase [Lentzea flaviverrucosa]SER75119.1 Inosine-uridine nucleoside N-ribohydrolase [Lentzea flaviverrucosa]
MSEELNRERQELAGLAQRFGLPQTVAGDPFPPSQEGAPLIIDTDAGGDPTDVIALVAAAAEPTLTLVSTVDELGGRRARFVRHLLDLLGREDVRVVAGADLGERRMDCIAGLVPDSVEPQRTDLAGTVAEVVTNADDLVRWVGMGPATNLAALLTENPSLAERLVVTQMGGALNHRDPDRADHNFRLDPAAANILLTKGKLPKLVLSDTTFTPELEIAEDSGFYRRLATAEPAWAKLVTAHMAQWFDRFHPGTIQHDGLALAAGLQLPYVALRRERVVLDDIGRMTTAPDGNLARISVKADHRAFLAWLTRRLDTALEETP